MTPHVVFQNDGGTNLVDQGFVLAGFLLQTAIEHGLMSQDRGETLVVQLDGNVGHSPAPTVDKLLHTSHILTGLAIRLTRLTDDDALYGFGLDIVLQPCEEV